MNIGLSKDEIIEKLNQNGEMISDGLFEKIAEIIVENNALIEKAIPVVLDKKLREVLRK